MKLDSVRIEHYRCILDSDEFKTNQITCFVGKNESGKTSILKALYKLNPDVDEESNFDSVIDYPRSKWSEYKERHETDPENIITSFWKLNDIEINAIKEIMGEHSLKSDKIIIKKGHNNKTYWNIPLNKSEIATHFLENSSLFTEEREKLEEKSINEIISHLEERENLTENETIFLQKLLEIFPSRRSGQKAANVLKHYLPTFLYFADYYKMLGNVSIDDLNIRINNSTLEMGHRIFMALLNLVGTSPAEIDAIGRSEALIAELEAVSLRLSEEIFRYWSQNRYLKVKFMFTSGRPDDPPPLNSGNVFRTRIENTRHGVSVNFDERSAGFVWFFSFLIWFSQVKKTYGENLFILLDDPGLTLHARAQADLLAYIRDQLVPNYQIMYTTHSPFLIDPDHLLDVRTVEDVVTNKGELLGTKISDKILTVDPDTIFPLQAALGYDITQTLFIGKNNLLVEGPSDLMYLKWFSHELESRGRVPLDTRWVIVPCGGIGKVSPFMSLFGSQALNVAVFTDYHKGVKGQVRNLKESELLRAGHVFSAEMYVDSDEADIEDLMGRHFYIELINDCYQLEESQKIPYKRPADTPDRVLLEVESHFKTLPIVFDHYKPSVFLTENTSKLRDTLPKIEEALKRFETLFKDLNELLD